MKNTLLALVVLVASLSFAQVNPDPTKNVATNNGQFTISANAMSLKAKTGTVAAMDLGSTFAVTTTSSVRADLILAPSGAQGYFGGLQYFLSSKKILSKTNFDPQTFQFYLTASGGMVKFQGAQHAGFLAGGGINYDPTHSSKFSINLIDVRAARLPNVSSGVVALVSGGLKLGW